MKHRILALTARISVILSIFAAGVVVNSDALAQQRRLEDRRIHRPMVGKDAIRQQQMKRAYIAGAVTQHRRELARDHHEDRFRRDRYYADHHHDHHQQHDNNDALTNVLIGAAIGAIATGVIIKSQENSDQR